MRLLIAGLLIVSVVMAGCSGGVSNDGTNNPPAKRLTDAEFESQRAKKGEDADR